MKEKCVILILLSMAAFAVAGTPVLSYTSEHLDGGLVKYVFTISGDSVTALDLTFNGTAGTFNQVWPYGAVATPIEGTHLTFSPATDTYFLFTSDELISINAPAEDIEGSYLAGIFGIKPSAVFDPMDIAQIVTVEGAEFSYIGGLSNAEGVEFGVAGNVPEPATLSLVAIGTITLFRRRK